MPVVAPIWRTGWKKRPFFYLVLFTAHPQGVWFYADALTDAMDEYYDATHSGQYDLFDHPMERRTRAVGTIESNLHRMVERGDRFTVLDRTLEVLAGALGDGGRKEDAAVIRRMAKNGELVIDGPTTASEIFKARLSRGNTKTLFR
jgi:hypothetical protein